MASDLKARLLALIQNLQQAGLQQVSVEQLSEGVVAAEADVRATLATFGAQLTVSDSGVQLPPDVFGLEVTGIANTQVGHINTQLNISGPLLHLHAGGERPMMTTETLHEALADPAAWHDLLEEQLVRQRSRAALTRILAVSSEQPEYVISAGGIGRLRVERPVPVGNLKAVALTMALEHLPESNESETRVAYIDSEVEHSVPHVLLRRSGDSAWRVYCA